MSQKQENDGETDAMAAIREAVEERQKALGSLDDGILDLDDVVWRSPARAIIDPTDTISRLAEEADKVAKGIEDVPPEYTGLVPNPTLERRAGNLRPPRLATMPRPASGRL